MRKTIIIALILIYIYLSAFLENYVISRIVPADVVLVLLVFFSLYLTVRKRSIYLTRQYIAALPLLIVFFIGIFQAKYVDKASLEFVIIVFGYIGSIAILNILLIEGEETIKLFAKGYVLLIGFLSFLCIIDFLILPGLLSSRNLGGLQGPFRNTGQAGSFFGVHLAIIIALVLSRLVPGRIYYYIAMLVTSLALIFTLKRASILAFVIGFILLTAMLIFSNSIRDKKLGVKFALFSFFSISVGSTIFVWGLQNVGGMLWRMEKKFSTDTVGSISESGGFIDRNIDSAILALSDNPIFGVGLGNVGGVYQHHEIHSTYFGVLAYGGLLGIMSYIFFMFVLIKSAYNESKYKVISEWSFFLYILVPLLIGLMVGWGYTYHLRKREFWILFSFIVLAINMSKNRRRGLV